MRFLFVIACVLCAGCFTRPVNVSLLPGKPKPDALFGSIPHFDIVSKPQNIYRGGQPTKPGFQYMHDILRVRTVLMLDTDTEGSDAEAELMGLEVVKIPIDLDDQMLGPVPVTEIRRFWIEHPRDVFVHCEHGQDRTGLAVYLYRRLQGMDQVTARAEMMSHGFHRFLWALYQAEEDN